MATKNFTQAEAIAFLKRLQGKKTINEFATKMKVSSVLIRETFRGAIAPGKALGFRKVKESIRYERIPAERKLENEASGLV